MIPREPCYFRTVVEALASVAFAAFLASLGWGVKSAIESLKEGVKFRTSLSLGLNTIAKELSEFRSDINKAMEQEQIAHRAEREEYKETHCNFERRISLAEEILAGHNARLSVVEDHIRSHD